jgi:hypothetical protein
MIGRVLTLGVIAAIEIERRAGLPCGHCGLPHATSIDDFERRARQHCQCEACCIGYSIGYWRREYPDIRGLEGPVIRDEALEEVLRRLKHELAQRTSRLQLGSSEQNERATSQR